MGRRALRKLDPQLELSHHLRTFDDLPPAIDAATMLNRTGDLEVEVGSGKGLFLSAAAATEPEKSFVGIELARKYARYAAARLARRGLMNACVISGDAIRVFRERVTSDSVAAVHVYFPDPWWKARHKKRRVMNEVFVRDIERTLRPGGTLHFWTDVHEYYAATVELLASATRLHGPLQVSERAAEHDLDYRTHFERRMRLHGLPVYRSEFRKLPS